MKRKNIIYGLLILWMVFGIFSCKQSAPKQETVTGYVADATMNNIMLVTNAGDTMNISTMDADRIKVPGVLINDSVKITFVKEKMGENEIIKAEELTVIAHSPYFYIQGTWVEPNPINPSQEQGVILKADGTASSVGMATLIFEKWVLTGDQLLLTSKSIGNKQTLEGIDTLQIVKLNADSLVLSDADHVVWRFARKN